MRNLTFPAGLRHAPEAGQMLILIKALAVIYIAGFWP
ncbi:hypothetical protein SAMN05444050_4197 [Afipia sp. GAS231]|nr:hypothetical protein SAMN05444050_4197 [Afipia sp. GAS231]